MNYPLILEYVEAIKMAEDNFEELSYLRPVLDDTGQPVMSSGNFAVVFKMKDERDGKLYAVRCFHRDQEGREECYRLIEEELKDVESPYLVSFRYIDKELFVDSSQTDETEFPVLLMDWVEGITLDKYLRENIDDQYTLEMLAYRFSLLAQWLIPQPFAHGDLKPDNILVREDGTLVLVDYDGMYVPAMKGQKARELGSPDFRHPLRTEDDFDEHIDDFPFVSILLSLKVVSIDTSSLVKYGETDRLLLSERDYRDVSKSLMLKEIFPSEDIALNGLVSLLFMLLTEKYLSFIPLHFISLLKSFQPLEDVLSTEIADEDLAGAWMDEFGVKYSNDINRKRVLKAPNGRERELARARKILQRANMIPDVPNTLDTSEDLDVPEYICIKNYSVLPGTRIVCDNAFQWVDSLYYVHLPKSIISIGKEAFYGCCNLVHIYGGENVINIGERAFQDCIELKSFDVPSSVQTIGKEAFGGCKNLVTVRLSGTTINIEKDAFSNCNRLRTIIVPKNSIENYRSMLPSESNLIFEVDEQVCEYNSSVSEDDFGEVYIDSPDYYGIWYRSYYCGQEWYVREGDEVLYDKSMKRLLKVSINQTWYDNGTPVVDYSIIRGTQIICDKAFLNCFIEAVHIPYTVRCIGNYAFAGCSCLYNLDIPDSVISIGNYAFSGCYRLHEIVFPPSVFSIGEHAFEGCSKINKIDIPNGIVSIDDHAFANCNDLVSINFPYTLQHIGKSIFQGCESLTSIYIPEGCMDKFKQLLPQYIEKLVEMVEQEKEIESDELPF